MGKKINWKERARMLSLLPLSGRAIRYFPPEFVLRDPLASSIFRQFKNSNGCALILLNLGDYHQLLHIFSSAAIDFIERTIKQEIRKMLPMHFADSAILGARQIHGEDYCIFVSTNEEHSLKLHDKAVAIRDDLEQRIHAAIDPHIFGRVHFRVGFYMMKNDGLRIPAAISLAYHYAHAIATKKLPANFYHTRKQIAEIIASGNINVLFQPILNLQTGAIYGWEALTRGPENTAFYHPMDLFDFAYQSELLLEMEALVFRKAMQQISKLLIGEQIFINVTSVSIGQPQFFDRVLEIIDEYPAINTRNLVLEITECHTIRDYGHMAAMMQKYREQGFRFAVDDAGAGYSSLQTISELIPDLIKIDKSLIKNIDQIAVKQSLLKAFVGIAAEINCQIIAEGIERKEEAELLSQHRIEMGQGFYFAKPQVAI